MSAKTTVKLPKLHIVEDAQGPMGIMSEDGYALAWFSEAFVPTNGYWWPQHWSEDWPAMRDARTAYVRQCLAAPALVAALREAKRVLEQIEVNLSNYNHDDVAALNASASAAWDILRTALAAVWEPEAAPTETTEQDLERRR